MHLRKGSLICPDRRITALSPAYDLLSAIPCIDGEDMAALDFSWTKKMTAFDVGELKHLAARVRLREKCVVDIAAETVQRFRQIWRDEKGHWPLDDRVTDAIDKLAPTLPLFNELA